LCFDADNSLSLTEQEIRIKLVKLTKTLSKLRLTSPHFRYPKKLKLLGRGTYGKVVLRGTSTTKNCVAVKTLNNSGTTDNNFSADAVREISTLVALKGHPNIVQVLGYCFNSGRAHIILEVGQEDLHSALQNRGLNGEGGDTPIAKKVIFQILSGLHYMHSIGLWHRDIKQQNILVFPDDVVKICDFSVARGAPFEWIKTSDIVHSLW
jgi:serine/threonine protein kinase